MLNVGKVKQPTKPTWGLPAELTMKPLSKGCDSFACVSHCQITIQMVALIKNQLEC